MAKVYVVSSVDWSDDVEILAVYDNEAEAKRVSDMINDSDCREFIINEFEHDEPPVGMKYFNLEMKKDGKLASYWDTDRFLDDKGKRWDMYYSLEAQQKFPYERGMWRLSVSVYAKSKKQAVKIANDMRLQFLADSNKSKEGKIDISW